MKEFFEKIFGSIHDFIMTNGENPIFWLILFFAGIALFWFTYNALHKNGQ